jgi:hypothetical protein
MNILENYMPLFVDPMAGNAKCHALAGPSEKVIVKLSVGDGKGVNKVARYATQLPVHQWYVKRHCGSRVDIHRVRRLLSHVGMTTLADRA